MIPKAKDLKKLKYVVKISYPHRVLRDTGCPFQIDLFGEGNRDFCSIKGSDVDGRDGSAKCEYFCIHTLDDEHIGVDPPEDCPLISYSDITVEAVENR